MNAISISQTDFMEIMSNVISRNFPAARLAYAEEQADAVSDFYDGKAEQYLTKHSGELGGDFRFGEAEILGALPVVTSVITLLKLAAETYLTIGKVRIKDKKDLHSQGTTQEAASDADEFTDELITRISKYLPREKAVAIAFEIEAGLIQKSNKIPVAD